ncbi:response regulator transcription factor [Marinobacter sp. chi1]|uniref:Response regulator transcription factor n=1 Tax=Marinobacter suaedae TaxID=3057675 RepID=A0ABT8VW01_9GAMM|nr:response regulator transcription factor [Marinobacter sp. chi1]MDO3720167.1 response regulator transcription factor [Marinobacter sp. chi1]
MEILIIDDHALFLDGLRHVLKALDEGVHVYCEESVQGVQKHLPVIDRYDLILLDMHIGADDGVDLLKQLTAEGVMTPVVIVSASENIPHIQSALNEGALGFISKSFSADKVITALKTVLAGKPFIEQQTQQQLNKLARRQQPLEAALTKKQKIVLTHLRSGLSNKQIAEKMFLTENTVKSHLAMIYQKLGVKNRMEAMLKVQRLNIRVGPYD